MALIEMLARLFKGISLNRNPEQPDENKVLRIKDALKARSRIKPAKFNTSGVEEITDETFQQIVLKGSKDHPVLVDFYATWCGPCQSLAPILEKIAQKPEYKGRIHFTKIDVDRNRVSANNNHIKSMPTLILFEFGRERRRVTGLKPPAILAMLNSSLGL